MSQTKAQLISDLVQALNFTGTSSAPANGMYLSAANTIKLATNSNGRLTIDSDGNTKFTGNIFTTVLRRDVQDSSVILSGGNATNDGANIALYGSTHGSQAGNFEFRSGAGYVLKIKSDGKVGIGTTNPDTKLHISSADIGAPQNAGSGLMIEGSSADLQFMSANDSYNHIFFGDPEDSNIGLIRYNHASNANSMDFVTNTSTALTLDSSQNASFAGFITLNFTSNNSTTAEGLFINNQQNSTGNNASVIFSNDSGNRKKAAVSLIDTGNYGAGDLVFSLDGADDGNLSVTGDEKVRITSGGNVGIGTSTPQSPLHVKLGTDKHIIYSGGQGEVGSVPCIVPINDSHLITHLGLRGTSLRFAAGTGAQSAAQKMEITSTGVAIGTGDGTVAPAAFFHIHCGTGKNILYSGNIGEIGNLAGFQATNDDASALAGFGIRGSELRFATGSDERFRITSDGTIHVNSDDSASGGRLYATGSAMYVQSGNGRQTFKVSDAASGVNRTWELTTDGNLKAPAGKGIDFSNQTSTSTTGAAAAADGEVLTHYEEGTWLPVPENLSNTPSYHNQTGIYTRVGNLVTVVGFIQFNVAPTFTSNTSELRVTGLPFTANGAGYEATVGNVTYQSLNWSGSTYNDYGADNNLVCGAVESTKTVFKVNGGNNTIRGTLRRKAFEGGGIITWQMTYKTND